MTRTTENESGSATTTTTGRGAGDNTMIDQPAATRTGWP